MAERVSGENMAKRDDSGLKNLRAQIKENKLKSLYLIYGDEDYLKHFYANKIKDLVVESDLEEFNYTVFEGAKQDISQIRLSIDTPPMMADKKMILIKDSDIFKNATEEQKEFWQSVFSSLNEDNVIVFLEDNVDKRGVIYKAFAKNGEAVDCAYLQGIELTNWISRGCREAGVTIGEKEVEYLLSSCDVGMNNIKRELEKLFAFCDNGKITTADIDKIVTKMPQNRVFEMINDMLKKNGQGVFEKLYELKTLRESPFGVLALLCINFEKIMKVKLMLEKGTPYKTVAGELKIFSSQMYVFSDAAKKFSKPFLREAMCKTAQIDFDIKSGKIKDWLALEQFLAWCIDNN